METIFGEAAVDIARVVLRLPMRDGNVGIPWMVAFALRAEFLDYL